MMAEKEKPAGVSGGQITEETPGSVTSAAYSTAVHTEPQPQHRQHEGPPQGTFDGVSWQDQFEEHLRKLGDPDLAANIRSYTSAKLRETLRQGDRSPLELLTADYILINPWPEPLWAVDGLLPDGLTILAGKPKAGKSWLALQAVYAVAAGGVFLGRKVKPGPTLYLALEDPPRRLKDRMQKQGWRLGLSAEFMPIGHFMEQIGSLDEGGAERLACQIKVQRYRLVVIDTMSRALHCDQSDVGDVTRVLAPIQEMAHRCSCAVLVIDHHRKSSPFNEDVIADILGSTAKGAVSDTAWGLYRERGKAGAKLSVVGRDVVEQNLALTWDPVLYCWQSEGNAGELTMTERRHDIMDVLAVLGRAQLKDIFRELGQDKSNTHRRLQDLVNDGKVQRIPERGKILYALSEPVE